MLNFSLNIEETEGELYRITFYYGDSMTFYYAGLSEVEYMVARIVLSMPKIVRDEFIIESEKYYVN